MDELFEPETNKKKQPKQLGRLYRKVFLLVFAIALLAQSMLLIEKGLADYYRTLQNSFKVLLTIDTPTDSDTMQQWENSLSQTQDITSVRLLSPEDALTVVRHKNPQLVDAFLLMGKNQMPAYFELTLSVPAINNIRPFIDNLGTAYEELTPHYNAQHAQLLFEVGLWVKLLRLLGGVALLAFIAFMFLVEATPTEQSHAWGGLFSGLLAGVLSGGLVVVLVYPTGLLSTVVYHFTTWPRQAVLVVFCGLLGWTFSKWQKF